MDNQIQIESNGLKFVQTNKLEDQLNQPIYSTRKSSRRLNQLNSIVDHNFNLEKSLDKNSDNLTNLTNKELINDNKELINKTSLNIQQNTTNHTQSPNQQTTKQQRKWEQWTQDDTRWFFEALNENGKDFNAIHTYMTTKLKKKGITEELIKNKEQIRCYFNRQWNKICSIFEECNDDVNKLDKTTKQLYALINYGEMWKKNNFKNDLKLNDSKFKAHLYELVFKGYTFLKIGKKGKNIKLKTPVCKALKKIYYFEDIYKSVNQNLPKDIIIELVPSTNYAWMKVHSLAQNPRVRVKCSLQKKFSTLIHYLEERWNDQKYNNIQINLLSNGQMKSPKNDDQNDNLNNDNSLNNNSLTKKVFKVKPHSSHHKNLTALKFTRIQPIPFNSQMDISLSAYLVKANKLEQQKVKNKKNPNVNCSKKLNSNKDDDIKLNGNLNQNEDNLINKTELVNYTERSNTSHVLETVRELNLLNNIVKSSNYLKEGSDTDHLNNKDLNNLNQQQNQQQFLEEEKSLHLPVPPPNATIAEWLSANIHNSDCNKQNEDKDEDQHDDSKQNLKSPSKETSPNKDSPTKEDKLKESHDQHESIYNKMKNIVDPVTVKNGWSADEIEDLTIGELYLMLKKPVKIVLQYDWNIVVVRNSSSNNSDQQESNNNLNQLNENAKDKNQSNLIVQHHSTNCGSLVSKLITAFTLELMNINNKEKNNYTSTAAVADNTEVECNNKQQNGINGDNKNQRKTKKLKTSHSVEDQIDGNENNNNNNNNIAEQILSSPNNHTLNDHETTTATVASTNISSNKNNYQFVVPNNPPKQQPANNKRFVNEKLLREAKDQLCNYKFNNSRRNFRKEALIKQQQHNQQLQLNNICQLFANQSGTLTTLPVNVSSASNGQIISVITQVNNQNQTVVPNTVQTINLDSNGTKSIQTVQINNATTLNELCNYVTKSSNEQHLNDGNNLNNSNNLNSLNINLNKDNEHQEFTTNLQHCLPTSVNNTTSTTQLNSNLQDPPLAFNSTSILNDEKINDNKLNNLNHFQDDKSSVGFSNLLDISLSDTIFNETLAFPSDVSIDSNFSSKFTSSKDIADQTLNTPIKLNSNQKSINNNSFTSQFNLFENSNNRSTTFSDVGGWMNSNLSNDLSLGTLFDEQFKDNKKDELFNDDFNVLNNNHNDNLQTFNGNKK